MEINWFTFFAQIVNFLILLVFLRHFLYRPVLKAMQAREAGLAARFQTATEQTEAATLEREQFLSQQDELNRARAMNCWQQPRQRLKRVANATIGEAREEVEEMQGRWYAAVEHEQALFLHELQRRLGESAMEIARRALADLADEALESRIVDSFVQRLEELEPQARAPLPSTGQTAQVVIRTTFNLPYAKRQQLVEALQHFFASAEQAEEISVRFECSPELVCGVEMQAGARRITWCFRDYVDGLAGQLEHLFDLQEEQTLSAVETAQAAGPRPDLAIAPQCHDHAKPRRASRRRYDNLWAADHLVHAYQPALTDREFGIVTFVGQGIARVDGLPGVRLDELVEFDDGMQGIIFNLDTGDAGVVLLGDSPGTGRGCAGPSHGTGAGYPGWHRGVGSRCGCHRSSAGRSRPGPREPALPCRAACAGHHAAGAGHPAIADRRESGRGRAAAEFAWPAS